MEHNQGTKLKKTLPNYAISLQLGQLVCVPTSFLVTMTIVAGPELKTTIAMRLHLLLTEKKRKKKKRLISSEISNLVSSIFKGEK